MNLKTAFFYSLYTITAFFIIAWIAFPSQKAADLLSDKLNSLSDNVEVKINKVKPGMLFICKIKHSKIIINNKIELVFGSIKIVPSLLSIFSDEKKGKILFSDIVAKMDDIPILKIMEMSELNFSNIEVKFKKNKEKIEIINFDAKGNQCDIKAKGNIYFFNKSGDLEKTRLDLQINILPNPSFLSKFAGISSVTALLGDSKESIKLNISGALKNPKIKL